MNKFELRCEICSGKFDANNNLPKVLSCGHTVCAKCVDRMKDKNINKCPFDRKVLDFEESNIAVNYYILQLIDTSISEVQALVSNEEEEKFELNPRPVVNSPGWKNTINGFIKDGVLHTVETNGFIYCTELSSGLWWFMYHNQFFGNFFFQAEGKTYLIDQHGSMFQIFNKNYYVQTGKKNFWKNTSHLAVVDNKVFSIESGAKISETNISTGKVRELNLVKNNSFKDLESVGKALKNVTMMISVNDKVLFANKNGELYAFDAHTQDVKLVKNDFPKTVESASSNSTHMYFIEKSKNIIYRMQISSDSDSDYKKSQTHYEVETFNELGNVQPIKVIADDKHVVIIDKLGEIHTFSLENKQTKNFQCLFMLRNCHLQNSIIIGDGDLLLLDPIRLSLNKLNLISGTEVIVLHSTKFLNTIKNIFSINSKIYFIDISGNLYSFNESEKKLTQIGNNNIFKHIVDYGVHKNFLLTIENGSLYRTSLSDGNYIEMKHEQCKNYEYFFCDNVNIIFITKDDEVNVYSMNPNSKDNDQLKLKTSFKHKGITAGTAVTYFKNQIIYYNKDSKSIESVNVDDQTHNNLVNNFPKVNMFINNHDFMACILNEGVIYKLYC